MIVCYDYFCRVEGNGFKFVKRFCDFRLNKCYFRIVSQFGVCQSKTLLVKNSDGILNKSGKVAT